MHMGIYRGPDFFYRAPPLFGSKSTISRFGERFRDGQYSLVVSCCSSTHDTLRAQPFVKVGGTCPLPCPMESAPPSGSAFQVLAAAVGKALLPIADSLKDGATRWLVATCRSVCRPDTTRVLSNTAKCIVCPKLILTDR